MLGDPREPVGDFRVLLRLSALPWEGTMTKTISKRGTVLAYAASLAVMAGLLTVVALGGSAFTTKRTAVEFTAVYPAR